MNMGAGPCQVGPKRWAKIWMGLGVHECVDSICTSGSISALAHTPRGGSLAFHLSRYLSCEIV